MPGVWEFAFNTDDLAARSIGKQIKERQDINISDADLLNLIIRNIDSSIDAKKLSSLLIDKFETLGNVFLATVHSLNSVEGMTNKCALLLKFFEFVHVRIAKSELSVRSPIDSPEALQQYLIYRMAHLVSEEFWIIYLDNRSMIIRDERVFQGTVNECAIYPREVIRRALELGACSLILVHNHPSRRKLPSLDDIKVTRELAQAARMLSIGVHDHIIVSGGECISMRELGHF